MHQSPLRSMSDLNDHTFFTMPNHSLTPYKTEAQTHYCSSSTDSRCSWMPMDSSLYNSFGYHGLSGFGSGGVTPAGSIARSQHIPSSMLQPMELFFPNMLPTHSSLTAEQMTKIFHLGAECQALGTQLAKQF